MGKSARPLSRMQEHFRCGRACRPWSAAGASAAQLYRMRGLRTA